MKGGGGEAAQKWQKRAIRRASTGRRPVVDRSTMLLEQFRRKRGREEKGKGNLGILGLKQVYPQMGQKLGIYRLEGARIKG